MRCSPRSWPYRLLWRTAYAILSKQPFDACISFGASGPVALSGGRPCSLLQADRGAFFVFRPTGACSTLRFRIGATHHAIYTV